MVNRQFVTALLTLALITIATTTRADLVVLQYHHISDSTPPSTSTSVSLFRAQLDMIENLGLPVVDLHSATRAALAGDPAQTVALTFDDAYDSVYQQAAPMLAKRNWPYTVFVNTRAVGSEGYMTWDQLAELAAREGVTIANHSADHGHLARKPGESLEAWHSRIDKSLDQAQSALRDRLGTDAPLFAYPYGEFDAALEAELSERGWFGYGQQSGAIGSQSGQTRLPRFPMANAYGQLSTLKTKLQSQAFPVDAEALPDGVLSSNPPTLSFPLADSLSQARLACFASGMGRIEFTVDDGKVLVQAPKPFNSRRFRYNCTHPAKDGSYYWLSQQWLDLSQPED